MSFAEEILLTAIADVQSGRVACMYPIIVLCYGFCGIPSYKNPVLFVFF